MRENGSPVPVFESDDDRTRFVVRLPVHERVRGEPTEQDTLQGTPQVTGQGTGQVQLLVPALTHEMVRAQLQSTLRLAHRDHFTAAYLRPALEAGLIEMTLPDRPTNRTQRYRRTAAADALAHQTRRRTPPHERRRRALHLPLGVVWPRTVRVPR